MSRKSTILSREMTNIFGSQQEQSEEFPVVKECTPRLRQHPGKEDASLTQRSVGLRREKPVKKLKFPTFFATETRSHKTASTANYSSKSRAFNRLRTSRAFRRYVRGLYPTASQRIRSETRNVAVTVAAWAAVSSGVNRGGRIGNSSRTVGAVFVKRDPRKRAAPTSQAADPETCAAAASR